MVCVPRTIFAAESCGKYASRYGNGANVVLLAPDVAEEFPTARAVIRPHREFLKLKTKRRIA
jgi:hypothetical protein